MSTVSVRYIVDDVDAAIEFYCTHLGFHEVMHPDPAFAMLTRGDLRLVVVSPVGPDHRAVDRDPCPTAGARSPAGGTAS
jgi:catechol 2,3-dioxygenase-like lactoylglutathione lyase family enzyme